MRGLGLAVDWNVSKVKVVTDSRTVFGWLTNHLKNIRRVKVGGLYDKLVQRRLQIIEDLVAVTGMKIDIEWVPSAENLADQLTQVPDVFTSYWKSRQKSESAAGVGAVRTRDPVVPLIRSWLRW